MPKVNYDKQPERLCRWNKKFHGSKDGEYWCDEGEGVVDEDKCMKCFCNDWYIVCSTCNKEVIKTELTHVFLPEYKMGHICNDCYNGEEKVDRELSHKEASIIFEINKWKELNKKSD